MPFSDSSFSYTAITAQLRFRKVIFTVLVEAYTALLCPAPSGHEFQSQGFWSLCDVNDVFLLTDPVLTVCAEWRLFNSLIVFNSFNSFPLSLVKLLSYTYSLERRCEKR